MHALPKIPLLVAWSLLLPAVAWGQTGLYVGHPYGTPAALEAPSTLEMPAPPVAPAHYGTPAPEAGEGVTESVVQPQPSLDSTDPAAGDVLDCVGAYAPRCNRWWFQVGGLVMARDYNDDVWLSYDATDPTVGLLGTPNIEDDYQGGVEATFGYRFGHNWWLLATYWTLEPMSVTSLVQDSAGQISTALDFRTLSIGGTPVNDWYDNALAHKANLRSEFHNVELNLFHDSFQLSPCWPVYMSYLVGARWLQFDEDFLYASADTSTTFGTDPANEAYLDIDVSNNLVGAQVGCMLQYYPTCRWSVFLAPRVGIYSNHITMKYRIYSGDGQTGLDVRANKGDFATLAQLDIGTAYHVTPSLSLYLGYRLVSVSGVALTTDQMPRLLDDLKGIQQVDANGHLFLHGGFAGLVWTF